MKGTNMRTIKLLLLAALLAAPVALAQPASAHPAPPANNPCVSAIRRVFPASQQARAIAISYRESRWTETARNKVRTRLGHAEGCMQVLTGVARNVGARCSQRVAICNVLTSYNLWKKQGWRPWAVR